MLQMTKPPAHRFPPLPFITRRQHYDLWGPWLALCGPPADRVAMKAWLRPKR